MFINKISLLALAIAAGSLLSSAVDHPADERDPFAEFIAGISLLTTVKNSLPSPVQLQRFATLEKVTGVRPEEARTFLQTLRDDPEKGKQLYDRMNRLYSARSDTTTR